MPTTNPHPSQPAPLPSAEPVAGMNLIEVAPPWVIFFEDQSVRPVFYRGTEADARAVLAHYETQWACHLYVSASAIARTTPPAAAQDTGRMCGALMHIETLDTGTLLGVLVSRDTLVRPIVSGDIYEIRKVADWDAARAAGGE